MGLRGSWQQLLKHTRQGRMAARRRQVQVIVAILSTLTLVLVLGNGYLIYGSLVSDSMRESRQEAQLRSDQIAKQISHALTENAQMARAVAGLSTFRRALRHPDDQGEVLSANELLAHFARTLSLGEVPDVR